MFPCFPRAYTLLCDYYKSPFSLSQPDLLKQLFQTANRNMLGKEARTRGMNVIKAEDIEKRIPYDEASVKGTYNPLSCPLFGDDTDGI